MARAATGSDVVPAQPTPVWNHNSASPIGPRHWGDIGYPTCGTGMGQSPVNIDTRAGRRLNGPPLLMDNVSSELLVENTGHVVEVMILAAVTDTLLVGPDTYRLVQYHFHRRGANEGLDVDSFYTYNGSLTTPGCTEGVRWFLLADGGHVLPAAVERFHFVISRFPGYDGYPTTTGRFSR